MPLYSKEYLRKTFIEANADVRRITQVVLHWVTPLAATMLSLLCPLCSVVELPIHSRILICVAAALLLLCLLVAIRASRCLVQGQVEYKKRLLDFLNNYEQYSEQLSAVEQIKKLQVDEKSKPIEYAYTSLKLFAAALFLLFAVLVSILFA